MKATGWSLVKNMKKNLPEFINSIGNIPHIITMKKPFIIILLILALIPPLANKQANATQSVATVLDIDNNDVFIAANKAVFGVEYRGEASVLSKSKCSTSLLAIQMALAGKFSLREE